MIGVTTNRQILTDETCKALGISRRDQQHHNKVVTHPGNNNRRILHPSERRLVTAKPAKERPKPRSPYLTESDIQQGRTVTGHKQFKDYTVIRISHENPEVARISGAFNIMHDETNEIIGSVTATQKRNRADTDYINQFHAQVSEIVEGRVARNRSRTVGRPSFRDALRVYLEEAQGEFK